MFRQIAALYSRYSYRHFAVQTDGDPILNGFGQVVGQVEQVCYDGGRLHVSGWVSARDISLRVAGCVARVEPTIWRRDVAEATGARGPQGFAVSTAINFAELAQCDPPGLVFDDASAIPAITLRNFPRRMVGLAQLRCGVRFVADGVGAMPAFGKWLMRRDPHSRSQIKTAFGLGSVQKTGGVIPDLMEDFAPPKVAPDMGVNIVLPVYGAIDLLRNCLARIAAHTEMNWHLFVVEDASPDPDILAELEGFLARHRDQVTLIKNHRNQGFVGSVNRGFAAVSAHDQTRKWPVVLLNSDASLPDNWAARLILPILSDSSIASVTPMSNAAELMSVPNICCDHAMVDGQADQIDAVARRLDPSDWVTNVPTGVGFCMALSRPWFDRFPSLDHAFGRGYGEEVDWCQKTRQVGAQHVIQPALFVEHIGGQSFASDEKQRLIRRHHRIILRRYPDYDKQVQDFLRSDPASGVRVALAMAWAASFQGVTTPVFLAHSLGGGAEKALQNDVATYLRKVPAVVVLRVGGDLRWRLEVVTKHGVTAGTSDSLQSVKSLIMMLPKKRVIYSCGVGDPDPASIPDTLLSLLTHRDDSEVKFHDYLPVSPSYNLLDEDGAFHGVPRGLELIEKSFKRPDGTSLNLLEWQENWAKLIARSRVTVFSQSSKNIVETVWPKAGPAIRVRPHAMPSAPRVAVRSSATMTIAALGAIGAQKGAAVLGSLARVLADRRDMRLVLIGEIDPEYPLPHSVRVHGRYEPGQIGFLAERYQVTHWLIPSIWPETFCFTVHEALSTGLPSLAFDLGAQGDAVRKAPNGILLDASVLTGPDPCHAAALSIVDAVHPVPLRGVA